MTLKTLKNHPKKLHTYGSWEVFFLCSPDCPIQPRTSVSFNKFSYSIISGRISGDRPTSCPDLHLLALPGEKKEYDALVSSLHKSSTSLSSCTRGVSQLGSEHKNPPEIKSQNIWANDSSYQRGYQR